jgi:hypothetical protein
MSSSKVRRYQIYQRQRLITQDDFEVSIFFTDTSTPHTLLTKSIAFSTPKKAKPMTDWLEPGKVDDEPTSKDNPIIIREESPDEVQLADIPSDIESPTDINDEKKAPQTSYEGFSIYGRVLCLVIKRTNVGSSDPTAISSQQMMESWVSTQAAKDLGSTDLG